jgi:hypothetical protein
VRSFDPTFEPNGAVGIRRLEVITGVGGHMGRPPSLTAAQQKEAARRRAEGATLQELADSYERSISTMRRATRTA